MGLNVIKSFIRTIRNGASVTDVKCDPGGGAISTKEHYSAPGDDSFPLLTDTAVSVPVPGSGKEAVVGYLDPLNEAEAESGEKRIYSRQEDGTIVADVFLKKDGVVHINGSDDFAVAYNDLLTAFNQLKDDFNALVTAYNQHNHKAIVPAQPTALVPLGVASEADMTLSKVTTVRLP